MLEACGRIYPGVTAVAERMLPTYPFTPAAGRRRWRRSSKPCAGAGLEPCVTRAVREAHEALAGVQFPAPGGAAGQGAAGQGPYGAAGVPAAGWGPAAFIEHLAGEGFLSGGKPAGLESHFDAGGAAGATRSFRTTLETASGRSHGR